MLPIPLIMHNPYIIDCNYLIRFFDRLFMLSFRTRSPSEAQKEAAVELLMKTHGGRSFLRGHLFDENVHEYLAPCIYEGEGEMLGMAFFKSLIKEHGKTFFEPIGKALVSSGIRKPNMMNPAHAWALRS